METQNTAAPATAAAKGGPVLEITLHTDPLCCWSWGMEPQLRRLRYGFAGRIAWRLRMGGMIGDWASYGDPLNDIHRPVQMGPLWVQAATVTGMPADATIWVRDPPASSWPACLAVTAAGLQSAASADIVMRGLQEAVMLEGRNISRAEVVAEVAQAMAAARPDLLDPARLVRDMDGAEARAALKEDVREARFRGITRFPGLGLRRPGAEPRWLVGWRPWGALLAAMRDFSPDLGPERRAADAVAYRRYWGGAAAREIEVALAHDGAGPDPATGQDDPFTGALWADPAP